MRACVRLSSGAREADGFHNLLDDSAQDMFDLATDREARRERQGYLSPTQARAFLQMSRQLQLGDSQPPSANPVARAYFRAVEWAAPADAGSFASARVLSAPGSDSAPGDAADVIAGVAGIIDVLRDAGVLTQPPRGLLEASHDQPSRLALIREYLESSAAGPEGLAFLANAMMAGCVVQARPFTEKEASDAAAAICNLGLENWPRAWPERDLLTAFQVGWTVVYRDVCLYAAEQLIDVLADLRCTDRDVLLPLKELRLALTKHCRERAPWRARNALEVIVMLDAPAWAALAGLIDECPVIHAALIALRGSGAKTVSATAFEFISENAQIAFVREFMRSLPAVLVS